jgi:MYXO-CTERM domain-containing protein
MSCRLLAVVGASCFCASASQGALFRFAGDEDHRSWTFTGGGNLVADAQDPLDPEVLLVDDHSGPLPPIPYGTEFQANFSIAYLSSVPMDGGVFMHNYAVNGTFSFIDIKGDTLLSATVTDAAMSAIGGALSWFSTGLIESADGLVVYTWNGDAVPGYNLLPGNSVGPDDFTFRLTSVNRDSVDVGLDPDTHLPMGEWVSEGSFSGSSNFIPAPGAAVLALGLLAGIRRRR